MKPETIQTLGRIQEIRESWFRARDASKQVEFHREVHGLVRWARESTDALDDVLGLLERIVEASRNGDLGHAIREAAELLKGVKTDD